MKSKKFLVQMYAYTGFPPQPERYQRFYHCTEERGKNGIKDAIGRKQPLACRQKAVSEFGSRFRIKN